MRADMSLMIRSAADFTLRVPGTRWRKSSKPLIRLVATHMAAGRTGFLYGTMPAEGARCWVRSDRRWSRHGATTPPRGAAAIAAPRRHTRARDDTTKACQCRDVLRGPHIWADGRMPRLFDIYQLGGLARARRRALLRWTAGSRRIQAMSRFFGDGRDYGDTSSQAARRSVATMLAPSRT